MKFLVLAIGFILLSCTKSGIDSIDSMKADSHYGQLKQLSDTTLVQIQMTIPSTVAGGGTFTYNLGVSNIDSVWYQVLGTNKVYGAVGWNQTVAINQAFYRNCKVYSFRFKQQNAVRPDLNDYFIFGLSKPYGSTLQAGDVFTSKEPNWTLNDYDCMFYHQSATQYSYNASKPFTFKVVSYKDNLLYATFGGEWVDTGKIVALKVLEL